MSCLGDSYSTIEKFTEKLNKNGKNVKVDLEEKEYVKLEYPEDYETSYVYVIYVDGKIVGVYEEDRDGVLDVINVLIDLI